MYKRYPLNSNYVCYLVLKYAVGVFQPNDRLAGLVANKSNFKKSLVRYAQSIFLITFSLATCDIGHYSWRICIPLSCLSGNVLSQ